MTIIIKYLYLLDIDYFYILEIQSEVYSLSKNILKILGMMIFFIDGILVWLTKKLNAPRCVLNKRSESSKSSGRVEAVVRKITYDDYYLFIKIIYTIFLFF